MSTQDRKAALELKIKQLKAQHAKLMARENSIERAKRTRQAVIIGSWMMANDSVRVAQIIANLTRDQDKAAFDIGPATQTNEATLTQ